MLLHQQLVFRIVSQTVVWVFESSQYDEKHAVIIGCEVIAKYVSNFAQLSSTISGAIFLTNQYSMLHTMETTKPSDM